MENDSVVGLEGEGEKKSFGDRLADVRSMWTDVIKTLTSRFKDIADVEKLLNEVYIRRQECVEHTSSLQTIHAALERKYNREKVARYLNLKTNAQLRYNSDSAIYAQIDVELEEMVSNIKLLDIHIKAMRETLGTIDDIIYGIRERVKLFEIINSMKF